MITINVITLKHLEAERQSSDDVVLESFAPTFAGGGAVNRFPVGEGNDRIRNGVFQGNLAAPVRALREA